MLACRFDVCVPLTTCFVVGNIRFIYKPRLWHDQPGSLSSFAKEINVISSKQNYNCVLFDKH
jgi:hypothetical protein